MATSKAKAEPPRYEVICEDCGARRQVADSARDADCEVCGGPTHVLADYQAQPEAE